MIHLAAETATDSSESAGAIVAAVVVVALLYLFRLFTLRWVKKKVDERNTRSMTEARSMWQEKRGGPSTPEPLFFSIGPFPPTVRSVAALRAALGQSYAEPRYSVRTPPAAVVDAEALSLHEAAVGTFLRIPADHIVSLEVRKRWIWPKYSIIPIRPRSLLLEVRYGSTQEMLMLTPVPSQGQTIARADVEAIATGLIERLRITRRA